MGERRSSDPLGPFLGSSAEDVTEKQLRSASFVRLFQNVYVHRERPITHRVLCAGASLIAPEGAVITGASAATLRGVELAGRGDPVEVALPEGVTFRAQRGIHIREATRGRIDAEPWHGIGVATPPRAALDLARNRRLHGPIPQTVGKLDAMLHAGLVTAAELAPLFAARHDHGIVHARMALELCDGRAESIQESCVRVRLIRVGLEFTPQVEVRDAAGALLARVDLGDEELKLAIEYDGEHHLEPGQRRHDELRLARLRSAGWTVIVITKDSDWEGPGGVIDTVRRTVIALREARFRRLA